MTSVSARTRHVVVIGASLAGLNAALAALEADENATVALVGREPWDPYDRPPLSKAALAAPPSTPSTLPGTEALKGSERATLLTGVTAVAIDPARHVVTTDRGEIHYDAAVITTGAEARRLPGPAPEGVHTLRTWQDAVALQSAIARGGRMVVVGAGFIGSEVAATARRRGMDVHILEAAPSPLTRSVGSDAGWALADLHARNGVVLRTGVTVEGFAGEPHVTGVILEDGEVVPADVVVIGVGASPATQWLSTSGLRIEDGLVCDEHLRTSDPHIFAAGDVARAWSPRFRQLLRLEHWTSAQEQGRIAGLNAAGGDAGVCDPIPYFWSDWYDSRIQFLGLPTGQPELIDGTWSSEAFTAVYQQDGAVTGVLTLNRRADIMKYRPLIADSATVGAARELAASRANVRRARAATTPSDPSPTPVESAEDGPNVEAFTEAMRRAGVFPEGAQLAARSCAPIGIGAMADTFKVALTWSGSGAGPATIVAKLPSRNDAAARTAASIGAYEREVWFYEELAPRTSIRVPRYYGTIAPDGLLLEDLSHLQPGDQFTDLPLATLTVVRQQLAELQAPFWNDPELAASPRLHRRLGVPIPGIVERMERSWSVTSDHLTADFDVEERTQIDRFVAAAGDWAHALDGPFTLTHHDFRVDNMMFDASDPASVHILDWQTVGWGTPMFDLAYLLATSLSPHQRREIERREVELHVHDLARRGVEWDETDAWRTYRQASFATLLMLVPPTASVKRSERSDAMFRRLLRHGARMALDLEADEFLPST